MVITGGRRSSASAFLTEVLQAAYRMLHSLAVSTPLRALMHTHTHGTDVEKGQEKDCDTRVDGFRDPDTTQTDEVRARERMYDLGDELVRPTLDAVLPRRKRA